MNKLAVVLWIGLAACSNQRDEEGRAPAQTGAVVGSASPSSPGAAGGGAASGGAASGGAPAPAANVGCATPTTLVCGDGQVDGCASGLTSFHVCVAKDAKPGLPCVQEIALECPAGQVDACLHSPPQANNHVCVTLPKPAP